MFHVTFACVILAIFFKGFGNQIFGFTLSNNVSTYLIYFALLFQLTRARFNIPVILLILYAVIAIHTFLINYSPTTFIASLIHLIGVVIMSITLFGFVSSSKYRIAEIVRIYYGFAFFAACFVIFQILIFMLFGESIHLQNLLGGQQVTTGRLAADILNFFPRASGFSSEPAHFALLLTPAVFIAVLVLSGRAAALGLKSKIIALIIIFGLLLTFSLVGYFALILAVLMKYRNLNFKTILSRLLLVTVIGGLVISQIPQMQTKLNVFANIGPELVAYEFTQNDLSGFALISNAIVAQAALRDSYFLGTGLRTHENSYNKYLYNTYDESQVLLELNSIDAGSLFIRLLSEFGVLGIIGFLLFLFRYKSSVGGNLLLPQIVNDMAFVFIVTYAIRNGGYLDPMLWLFVALYYYSHKEFSLTLVLRRTDNSRGSAGSRGPINLYQKSHLRD
ncbi:hypothetical protein [Polynucleobacter sinensis]|uniref:hypothetical protein n=1 Tax=Polynucleobacter sinensis TaxID=1743157 RepID=UPI00078622AC|nr:hypothetical protein [Polynucleobacter sinensis]